MALIDVALVACSAAAQPPAPTPAPASRTPTALQSTAEPTAAPGEVAQAFLNELSDLVDQVDELAGLSCDELLATIQDNPREIDSLHGFATTLKQLADQQPELKTDAMRTTLGTLDQSLGHLDGMLQQCGITTSNQA